MPNPGEDFDDPRHIYQVRARRAADEAERELFREIEPERQTPAGMLFRALRRELDGNDAR